MLHQTTARATRSVAAAGEREPLGNFGTATDDDLNWNTGVAKHCDQGVDTEAVDFSADKIANPWLGHGKQACSLSLGEPAGLNQLPEPDHQIGSDLEILSLFSGEAEVAEHVASGASSLDCHRPSFFCFRRRRKSTRRFRAKAMSASRVWGVRFSNAWITIDGVFVLRDIKHAVFEFGVYPDLVHAGADGGHRLPIIGHEALLDSPQLVACGSSGFSRKRAHILDRRSELGERLLDHGGVYTYLYVAVRCLTLHSTADATLSAAGERRTLDGQTKHIAHFR